jgi:hypothetical protein
MKTTLSGLALLAMLVCLGLWLGCGDDGTTDSGDKVDNTDFTAQEAFSFKVEVAGNEGLRLEGITGEVVITGVSVIDSVTITGIRRVRSESTEDAEEHLELLEVSVEDIGSEIHVKTLQPENPHGRSYEVDYVVVIPKRFEVTADNLTGEVFVSSIDNVVSVGNVTGMIEMHQISGSVFADVITGQIVAAVTVPTGGTIDMGVVAGAIELAIPTTTSAMFSANVGTGTVDVDNLVLHDADISTHSVTGRLGSGDGTISLDVVTGSIAVIGF